MAGKMEGRGTYRYANGVADVGRYKAGADVGEGARWSADRATAVRAYGATNINERSSRSHLIMTVHVSCTPRAGSGARATKSKLTLVDLAGNERATDTHDARAETRAEGASINQSLLSLKECIRAMDERGMRLPLST